MLYVPAGANTFGLALPSIGTTRPNNSIGTSVSPDTVGFGSWAQLGSDLTDDAHGLLVNIGLNVFDGTARETLVDIGVDPAGGTAYETLIPNLLAGGHGNYNESPGRYYFPVFVPAGASIAARAYGTVTNSIRVYVTAMQRAAAPEMLRRASFVESIGISGTGGTAVTAGGVSEGSWTLLGTTAKRCWWWQMGLQIAAGDVSWGAASIHGDLAVGDGTNFDVIIQDQLFMTGTGESLVSPLLTPGCEYDVPAGASIYARLQTSTTADSFTIAAYGGGG